MPLTTPAPLTVRGVCHRQTRRLPADRHRERTLYGDRPDAYMSRKVKLLLLVVVVLLAYRTLSSDPDVEVEYEVE